jgi:large subunit ribosomal protein L14
MIQKGTQVRVVDNSGAKKANCFAVKIGQFAKVGDRVMVSIREAVPNGKVKTGEKYLAIVVQTVAPIRRKGGDTVVFSCNSVVLVQSGGKNELVGTRVNAIVPREIPQWVRVGAHGVC